eukprot:1160792-Pelagomonas_calceolata.AAC.2
MRGHSSVWCMCRNLEVVQRQPIITSYIHVDQACSRRRWNDFGSLRECGVRCLLDDSLGEGVAGHVPEGIADFLIYIWSTSMSCRRGA